MFQFDFDVNKCKMWNKVSNYLVFAYVMKGFPCWLSKQHNEEVVFDSLDTPLPKNPRLLKIGIWDNN